MKTDTQKEMEQLLFDRLRKVAPMPWYLEQANDHAVILNDNLGETILMESFSGVPEGERKEQYKERSTALAIFLREITASPELHDVTPPT